MLGTNFLVGTTPEKICEVAFQVLDGHARKGAIPNKWDGHAAKRIVQILLNEA